MKLTYCALLSASMLVCPFLFSCRAGDLAVNMNVPTAPVKAGVEVAFTIVVTYNGNIPATNIRLFTDIPFGIQVISIDGTSADPEYNGGTMILRTADLPAGVGTQTVTLHVRHAFAGYFHPSVTVDATADNTVSGNEFSYTQTQATAPDDTDGDGLPDWWEVLNGLNPQSAVGDDGPDGDLDKDGMTNYEEYVADTKANDPNSKLRVEVQRQPNGDVDFVFASSSIRVYSYRVGNSPTQMSGPLSLGGGTGVTKVLGHLAAGYPQNVFYTLQVSLPQ